MDYQREPIFDPCWRANDKVLGLIQKLITLCLIHRTETTTNRTSNLCKWQETQNIWLATKNYSPTEIVSFQLCLFEIFSFSFKKYNSTLNYDYIAIYYFRNSVCIPSVSLENETMFKMSLFLQAFWFHLFLFQVFFILLVVKIASLASHGYAFCIFANPSQHPYTKQASFSVALSGFYGPHFPRTDLTSNKELHVYVPHANAGDEHRFKVLDSVYRFRSVRLI